MVPVAAFMVPVAAFARRRVFSAYKVSWQALSPESITLIGDFPPFGRGGYRRILHSMVNISG
jgi:hypothetical protein